jgi:dihydrofolate synthase/folylpolyglutamate synthase
MQPISTYADALNYIYSFIKPDRKRLPKHKLSGDELGRMRALLARLDNPHLAYPVLLIAGTKGKGSVAAMCDSMLRAAGYKTGLFTSPRLHTYRERIRIGSELISEADVIRLTQVMYPHCEAIEHLITFERMAAMAFLAFAQARVDIAVVEVGIGGRLDATNVTEPVVSVITSISYDHVHMLGNTLSKIAREKAGIIRPNGMVVCAPQYPEPMTVIEEVCVQQKADLFVAGETHPWRVGRASLKQQVIFINGQSYNLPLLGQFQAANAATALAAMETLHNRTNFAISSQATREGLASVRWPGRLEIISQNPFLVIDCAMNGDSARKLHQALAEYFPGRSIVLVFGSSRDHDYEAMLRELLPIARYTIITQSTSFKATTPETLAQTAQELGHNVAINPNVPEALQAALAIANEHDLICVAGSLFIAADARLAWLQHANLPLPPTDPV